MTDRTRGRQRRRWRRAGAAVALACLAGLASMLIGSGEAAAFSLRDTKDHSVSPGWRPDHSVSPMSRWRSGVDHPHKMRGYRRVDRHRPVYIRVGNRWRRYYPFLTGPRVVLAPGPSPAATAEIKALSQEVQELGAAIDQLKERLPEPQPPAPTPTVVRPRIQPKLILLDDQPLPDVTVYRGLQRGL